jgi:cytochrome o ubiquinol oxidase operon protein cyoD
MSIEHNPETPPEQQHVKPTPYVVGFILSLVFTIIPYYLVVEKTLKGNALLATIIGFAILQLIVQVVFFLHIGREKKPHFNLLFLISTVGIIFVVTVGSIWIMNHLHHNMAGNAVVNKVATDEAVYKVNGVPAGDCAEGIGKSHKIMLMDGVATPHTITAQQCDTLTFMNHDETSRTITFGTYDMPVMYAGEESESVRAGRNKLITLTEPGTFQFHDAKLRSMTGGFTVTPR